MKKNLKKTPAFSLIEVGNQVYTFFAGDDLSCNISYGSTKKVLWKCNLGHIYEAAPNHRTSSNTGCPYCANKKILKGYNDVVSLYSSD